MAHRPVLASERRRDFGGLAARAAAPEAARAPFAYTTCLELKPRRAAAGLDYRE